MALTIEAKRAELRRAQSGGDHYKAATIRGELLKLHRRALRRALALEDSEAIPVIQAEMSADLEPVTLASQGSSAVLLDLRMEVAQQIAHAIAGPFEFERLVNRPEPFVAISRSPDDSVRVTACLADENAVASFYRVLVASQEAITVTHALAPELAAVLDVLSDEFVAMGTGGAA